MIEKLIVKVTELQEILILTATGGVRDSNKYIELRNELKKNSITKEKLPHFVNSSRNLDQFWDFISSARSTYKERRKLIYSNFDFLLNHLENYIETPGQELINQKMTEINLGSIREQWEKALKRKIDDPEGSITMSRTLIESVCKNILEKLEIKFDEGLDLPKLYKLTARSLNLAPDQHTEKIFKQILNGCQSVVEGMSGLRNKLSDSHGTKLNSIKPENRHAELAVNLAGTMTMFLYETYLNNKNNAK